MREREREGGGERERGERGRGKVHSRTIEGRWVETDEMLHCVGAE